MGEKKIEVLSFAEFLETIGLTWETVDNNYDSTDDLYEEYLSYVDSLE